MVLLYKLAIKTYTLIIWLASFFNEKAKLWITGRRQIFERLETTVAPHQDIIWIHCASLGEFEQGRPIIEAIKENYPNQKILLTFFSPSGYEIRKDYKAADFIFYLPADTSFNARRFLDLVNPKMAIFVKYEFWHHYLSSLKQKNIPTILVSGIFRKKQIFFRSYGGFFRKMLKNFDHFFVQNKTSESLLQSIGFNNISIAGDNRIDRVLEIANQNKAFPKVAAFVGQSPTLICGSTWPADEKILIPFINQETSNRKFIIAPHEISPAHIKSIEQQLETSYSRFSESSMDERSDKKVLIIDNIGMLSAIYRYGDLAYIGGGFGQGIHNTLEPVAFGLPVIFGPKYQKFEEANQLIKDQAAFCIENRNDLSAIMQQFEKPIFKTAAAQKAKAFIDKNQGATKIIIEYLFKDN